jgi:hypothetical protein
MKPGHVFIIALVLTVSSAAQTSQSNDGALVLALDNSWNRALETNDTKALDLLLADTFVSIDIDGSLQTKSEFLASLNVTGYQPPAQVCDGTEQGRCLRRLRRRLRNLSHAERTQRKIGDAPRALSRHLDQRQPHLEVRLVSRGAHSAGVKLEASPPVRRHPERSCFYAEREPALSARRAQ